MQKLQKFEESNENGGTGGTGSCVDFSHLTCLLIEQNKKEPEANLIKHRCSPYNKGRKRVKTDVKDNDIRN